MSQPTRVLFLTMCNPSRTQCTHLQTAASSRITKFRSSKTGFLNTTVTSLYSNGIPSHQISIQQSTSRMWRDGMEIHIVDVQLTNVQQLSDAIMSIWARTSEGFFQHLIESIPQRVKMLLEAKGRRTQYKLYLLVSHEWMFGPLKCTVHVCTRLWLLSLAVWFWVSTLGASSLCVLFLKKKKALAPVFQSTNAGKWYWSSKTHRVIKHRAIKYIFLNCYSK